MIVPERKNDKAVSTPDFYSKRHWKFPFVILRNEVTKNLSRILRMVWNDIVQFYFVVYDNS